MSLRLINIGVYLALGVLGFWVLTMSNTLGMSGEEGDFGTGYFPGLLAISLIILSLLGIIQWSLNKEGEKVEIPHLGKIIGLIVLMSLYFISWNLFGYFYIQTFVFILIMLTIYRLPLGFKASVIIVNLLVTIGLTLFIYLVFNVFMYVQF